MSGKKEWEVSMAGLILGMGNPLLDISNKVEADTFEKYGIKAGDAILAEDKHQPLFKELADKDGVQYIAGGATQNSIRVAQWMLQKNKATSYMGCIGKDEFGEKLTEACKNDGVNALYMIDEKTPTGTCACCILDKERSLVTNLSAANNYKVDHLKEADNMAVLEKAKVVYSAGFFMTVCPDAMEIASKACLAEGKTYCLNLSAPFLMQVPPFKATLDKTMPFVDVLFGNETEAQTYAEVAGWSEKDIPSIAKKLQALPKEGSKKRTVVITQGADATIVCVDGEIKEYPIIKLSKAKLVDTNGAGDAYVGGFLSGLAQGKDMHYCCQAGAYAASVIVQRSGCTFPKAPRFTYRPPAKPQPLKKPRFFKIAKLNPDSKGFNLMVKVVKEVGTSGDFIEVVCGDDTGVATFSFKEDKKSVFKVGETVRVQNASVRMVKGFVRISIDKWAVAAAASEDTPGGKPDIEVKEDKDISSTEYELA
jgi:adenosine kinase